MKSKLSAALTAFAAIALFLPTVVRANDVAVVFTETSVNGGPETLSVTGVAGATISGTTDNWLITFPAATLGGLPLYWPEPPGETGFNILSCLNGDCSSGG